MSLDITKCKVVDLLSVFMGGLGPSFSLLWVRPTMGLKSRVPSSHAYVHL